MCRRRGRAALRGVCTRTWVTPTAAAAVAVGIVVVLLVMAIVEVVTAVATVCPVTAMCVGWRTISTPTVTST
jgi:hypothetical protein